jgi:hypothetical protein
VTKRVTAVITTTMRPETLLGSPKTTVPVIRDNIDSLLQLEKLMIQTQKRESLSKILRILPSGRKVSRPPLHKLLRRSGDLTKD